MTNKPRPDTLTDKDFEDAVENHYGTLCTIALAYVPWEHEDMVQKGMAKAWEQRKMYDPSRGTPLSFICSRVKSTCLNRISYYSASKRVAVKVPDMGRTIHEIYEVEQALRGWHEGLEPNQIQRVALSALGFSNSEIARDQGVTDAAVSHSLKQARARMRGEITTKVAVCGTRSKYNSGCRCSDCRKAHADYRKARRK